MSTETIIKTTGQISTESVSIMHTQTILTKELTLDKEFTGVRNYAYNPTNFDREEWE